MSKTICGFCESSTEKITNEHVFAEWIGPLFGAGRPEMVVRHTLKRDDTGTPPRFSARLDHRVRMACQRCNNGWLSTLESIVKMITTPMIRGHAMRLLTLSDQAVIARWAVKTATVGEYIAKQEQRYFTQAERSAIMNDTVSSRYIGAHVWLGRYDDKNDGVLSLATSMTYEDRVPRAHVSTFAIGRFVVQTLVERASVGMARVAAARPGPWDRLLIPIWPPPPLLHRTRMPWPPPLFIRAAGLDALFDRFLSLDSPRGPAPRRRP
jgi:hypothetical protein